MFAAFNGVQCSDQRSGGLHECWVHQLASLKLLRRITPAFARILLPSAYRPRGCRQIKLVALEGADEASPVRILYTAI